MIAIARKATVLITPALVFCLYGTSRAADLRSDVKSQIAREKPPVTVARKPFQVASYYEFGKTDFASREEEWTILRHRVSAITDGLELPYMEVSRYRRRGRIDYLYDIGGYLRLGRSVLNVESGWGQDVDFLYKFKALAELTHPLIGNLQLIERYKYLRYPYEDIHIISPGAIYYFDSHYILGYYNIPIVTGGRGGAASATIKANFNLFGVLDLWSGTAFGQRIYDVRGIADRMEQEGFLVFLGSKLKVMDSLWLYVNLLYGEEEPDFDHRSIEGGAIFRF
jgi:YaiO family outer membrane protein